MDLEQVRQMPDARARPRRPGRQLLGKPYANEQEEKRAEAHGQHQKREEEEEKEEEKEEEE